MIPVESQQQLSGELVIVDRTATLQIGDWSLTLTDQAPGELRREMLRQAISQSSAARAAILLHINDHPDQTALLVRPDGTVSAHEPATVVQLRPTLPPAPGLDADTYRPRFASAETEALAPAPNELVEPLVVMVANTKGGAGKTPLAVVLAEALASSRGGDVAVVDLDPTGDLAHRAGARSQTSLSKLARVARRQPAPTWTELTSLMDWQEDSRLWVVGAADAPVTGADLAAVIGALSAGIRVFVLDAGNNDTEEVYRQAAQLADQLVVPVSWDEATVRSGAAPTTTRLFEGGLRQLALRAIIVGTRAPLRWPPKARKAEYVAEFERLGHAVVELPTDRHIDAGGAIRWTSLRTRTRLAAQDLASKIIDRARLGQQN